MRTLLQRPAEVFAKQHMRWSNVSLIDSDRATRTDRTEPPEPRANLADHAEFLEGFAIYLALELRAHVASLAI